MNSNCSCNLHLSCGNARSLTHCATVGTPLDNVFFGFCFFFFSFFGHPMAYGVLGPGIRSEPQLWPMLHLWQCQPLLPAMLGQGLSPYPGTAEKLPILLCHSGNSMFFNLCTFSDLLVSVPYRVNYFHHCIYLLILFHFRQAKFMFSCGQSQIFPLVTAFITSQSFLMIKVIHAYHKKIQKCRKV